MALLTAARQSRCAPKCPGPAVENRVPFLRIVIVFAALLSPSSLPAEIVKPDPPGAASENTELYYAAKSVFSEVKHIELRLGGGYDLSNPYLNIFSLQAAFFWIRSSDIAFGMEGTKYFSSKRSSTIVLENDLAAYGYPVHVLAPNLSFVGLFRITPISGLVNFFSSAILAADISLVGRLGTIQYTGQSLGPIAGVALETHVGITPTLGFHSSVQWDLEKPGSSDWQWRSGFRLGPTWKF